MAAVVLYCRPHPTVTSEATFAAAPGEGHDGEDCISALPDDILRDVVSRLPIRDAVHTTTLSTRWRRIWRTAPLVLFDEHISASTEPERVAAINSVLASHMGPIRTIHLAFCNFNHHEHELARWPGILADREVQDLVFITPPIDVKLPLPTDILRCEKLRRLYLGFWAFPDTTDLHIGNFHDLRELAILGTSMEDQDLDHMLASTPVLEKLAFVVNNRVPKHVRLRGEKLKCALFYASTVVEVAVEKVALCLERLIMWEVFPYSKVDVSEDSHVGVRFAGGAPALNVLGYLDTKFHQLRFGDTNSTIVKVQADTKPSPNYRVPSVKILAIKVDWNVFTEVQMLPSLLRCFPNIEILHVESAVLPVPVPVPVPDDDSSENHNAEFFERLSPIECVQSHITKVFLYKFRGHQSEMPFLKNLALRANQMQKLTLVLPYTNLYSDGENNIKVLLGDLLNQEWASEACKVSLLRPAEELIYSIHKAFDLSIQDPFLMDDGKELFSAMKRREQHR